MPTTGGAPGAENPPGPLPEDIPDPRPQLAAGTAVLMPTRGEKSAPTFDAEKPKQLPRYFKDLELLFERAKIVADADKKRYATFYLEVEVAEVWEELPEFHSANKTYEEFKAAVIVMYPGADTEKRYTRVDVDQHVTKWRNRGIHSLNDWAEFYREFQAMCSWLRSRHRISDHEISSRLLKVFDPAQRKAIDQRLEIKDPDHDWEVPYTLQQLDEAARHLFRGPLTSRRRGEAASDETRTPGVLPVKQENTAMQAQLDALSQRIEQLTASLTATRSAPRPAADFRGPMICHYCGQPGHGMNNCPEVATDISTGLVYRNQLGKIVLPSGAFPPRGADDSTTMRQRVQQWHAANPGNRAKGSLSYAPAANNLFVHDEAPQVQIFALTDEQVMENLRQELAAYEMRKQRVEVVVPPPPHLRKRAEERVPNARPTDNAPAASAPTEERPAGAARPIRLPTRATRRIGPPRKRRETLQRRAPKPR